MKIEILVPQLGPGNISGQRGKISHWHYKKNQEVKKGVILCEIQNDEGVFRVHSPTDGKLIEILVDAECVVDARSVVAVMEST